jgi:hypothetical protein
MWVVLWQTFRRRSAGGWGFDGRAQLTGTQYVAVQGPGCTETDDSPKPSHTFAPAEQNRRGESKATVGTGQRVEHNRAHGAPANIQLQARYREGAETGTDVGRAARTRATQATNRFGRAQTYRSVNEPTTHGHRGLSTTFTAGSTYIPRVRIPAVGQDGYLPAI